MHLKEKWVNRVDGVDVVSAKDINEIAEEVIENENELSKGIKDGSITTEKIYDGSVTTKKLSDGAVTGTKLANGAVTTEKISYGAITDEKLANESVTLDKIADDIFGYIDNVDVGGQQISPETWMELMDAPALTYVDGKTPNSSGVDIDSPMMSYGDVFAAVESMVLTTSDNGDQIPWVYFYNYGNYVDVPREEIEFEKLDDVKDEYDVTVLRLFRVKMPEGANRVKFVFQTYYKPFAYCKLVINDSVKKKLDWLEVGEDNLTPELQGKINSGGGGGTWRKIADITTTEEVNGITATSEEFPNIPKCKEFIVRAVFPKISGSASLPLGVSSIMFNGSIRAFYSSSISVSYAQMSEVRCHIIIADKFIHAIGTENNRGFGNVVGNAVVRVGDAMMSDGETLNSVSYDLNDNTKFLPIGTKLVVYGKAEN